MLESLAREKLQATETAPLEVSEVQEHLLLKKVSLYPSLSEDTRSVLGHLCGISENRMLKQNRFDNKKITISNNIIILTIHCCEALFSF